MGADPAGPEAQALVKRWDALVAALTLGDAEVEASLARLWQDRDNWPAEADAAMPKLSAQAQAFIAEARRVAAGNAPAA